MSLVSGRMGTKVAAVIAALSLAAAPAALASGWQTWTGNVNGHSQAPWSVSGTASINSVSVHTPYSGAVCVNAPGVGLWGPDCGSNTYTAYWGYGHNATYTCGNDAGGLMELVCGTYID